MMSGSPGVRAIVPIILAAGASARMGRPKALLDFDGETCLDLVLDICRRSRAAAPVVVLGAQAEEIFPALPAEAQAVVNPHPERGQTSSLQEGLRALPPEAAGFLLFPVDLPLVRPDTVDRLLAAPGPIAIPVHDGRRGHPACFARPLAEEFLALADGEPAHTVVRRDPARVTEIAVEDPEILRRLNTPEDYAACLAAYRARRGSG